MILPSLASAPRDPCALETLARLPRAEAFDSLGAYLATDSVRDALCEQHRGRGYHDHLSFADRVGVRADALTRSPGSGHRAITPALERQILATQERAVYGKLARRPLSLAEAFRAGRTARLRPLFPAGLYRAAFGGLGKRRMAKGTRPVDGIGAVASGQPPGVPALPDAGLVPRAPVRVAGLAPTAAEFGRQIVPGDARLEDAPDAGEDLALVEGRAAGAAQAAGVDAGAACVPPGHRRRACSGRALQQFR